MDCANRLQISLSPSVLEVSEENAGKIFDKHFVLCYGSVPVLFAPVALIHKIGPLERVRRRPGLADRLLFVWGTGGRRWGTGDRHLCRLARRLGDPAQDRTDRKAELSRRLSK